MGNQKALVNLLSTILLAGGIVLAAGSGFAEQRAEARADLQVDAASPVSNEAVDIAITATITTPSIETQSNLDMRDDGYDTSYLFGMTKGLANSTLVPGMKVIFFLVTIPLDIVFLPFAAIGGFF